MTPATAAINGVSFRLHEDRERLYSFGYTCLFCGRNGRTTTGKSRWAAMMRHAEKATHKTETTGAWSSIRPLREFGGSASDHCARPGETPGATITSGAKA